MSLTNSPKFEDDLDSAPPEQPPSGGESNQEPPPSAPKRWTRLVMIVLAALVLLSGLLLVLGRGSTPETKTGSATIRGQVVNAQGGGVSNAIVYLEGMQTSVITDQSGAFTISGAPDGPQVIVVGITPEAPHFVNVSVQPNATKDVGQIVYQAAGTG
jgi:CarboxypepD_reg-like domain